MQIQQRMFYPRHTRQSPKTTRFDVVMAWFGFRCTNNFFVGSCCSSLTHTDCNQCSSSTVLYDDSRSRLWVWVRFFFSFVFVCFFANFDGIPTTTTPTIVFGGDPSFHLLGWFYCCRMKSINSLSFDGFIEWDPLVPCPLTKDVEGSRGHVCSKPNQKWWQTVARIESMRPWLAHSYPSPTRVKFLESE